MSYSKMSPKNQICSYGAHFATVAEKHLLYSFLSRQGVKWSHYIFGSLVHYFCLIDEILFVLFFFDEIGWLRMKFDLKHRLKKGKSLYIASIIFIFLYFLFFYFFSLKRFVILNNELNYLKLNLYSNYCFINKIIIKFLHNYLLYFTNTIQIIYFK